MKPKTKFHREILKVRKTLPKINKEQHKWAYDLLPKYVYYTKHKCKCTECNHIWDRGESKGKISCPKCNITLIPFPLGHNNKKIRTFMAKAHFQVIQTFKGLQVVRGFYYWKEWNVSLKPGSCNKFSIREVNQNWISKEGKHACLGLLRYGGYWSWRESYSGNFEIRDYNNSDKYYPSGPICPKRSILKEIRRAGWNGNNVNGWNIISFSKTVLKYTMAETLLKYGYLKLFDKYVRKGFHMNKIRHCIRIALKHGYDIENDFYNWNDLLNLMRRYKMDTHNAVLINPDNNKLHQKLLKRKRKEDLEEIRLKRIDNSRLQKVQDEKLAREYVKMKKSFFSINIKSKKIEIKPLKTVNDFRVEEIVHNHCVFTNGYYKKKDSLLFSARLLKDNRRIETIEFDLNEMCIIQARGHENEPSEFHNEILDLINNNMHKIKELC